MLKKCFAGIFLGTLVSPVLALNIVVAPSTGTTSANPTNTVSDAIAQINAGADANNTITLRSTEGAINLADNAVLNITAGKSVAFVAESGRPVVVLNWASGRYMVQFDRGATDTLSFTGIGFVPEVGLNYGNNVADGFNFATGGDITFTDCIFASNNGSNGLASLDGALAFVQSPGGNNVGDDWIQVNSVDANLTLTNCVLTGAADDAVLFGGGLTGFAKTLTLDGGTVIANNGGAGVQIFGDNSILNLDGNAGRVLIAKNGLRSATNDTGVKFFADLGCAFTMTKADIIDHTNGGFFDFGGVPSITITDSRLAFNNASDVATGGNFSIDDADASGVGDSGGVTQTINFTRVTIHDALGVTNADSIYGAEGANDPRQAYTIVDSIISGAGDSFANMTNATASGGASAAPVVTTSAIVTNGAHAIATAGDIGTSALNSDPAYASLVYTIGRSQANTDFLRPTTAAYLTASSSSGVIGGAPNPSAIAPWHMY